MWAQACKAGGYPGKLVDVLRMALNNGATRQDIVETFLQIAPYAGFPACWEGLTLAQKVFREMEKEGPTGGRQP